MRSVRGRRGRQHDRRRRDGEVGPVVLADAEDVEPDLIRELDLLDEVAQALPGRDRAPCRRVGGHLAEAVEADLHGHALYGRSTGCRAVGRPVSIQHKVTTGACRHRVPASSVRCDMGRVGVDRVRMSSLHQDLVQRLRALRSADGGFGLSAGLPPEPEPTAIATLALDDDRGRAWLADRQAADGGFAQFGEPSEDCATAALAALALAERSSMLRALDYAVLRRAPVIGESGVEDGGGRQGWGWTPDTHSWVEPTARVLLATVVLRPDDARTQEEAIDVLHERQTPDGGWNYGNATVLGVDLRGYAQTTSVALHGLQHDEGPLVERGLAFLKQRWRDEPGGLTLAQALVAFRLHGERQASSDVQEALGHALAATGFLGNGLALAWAALATSPEERLSALRSTT